MIICSWDRLFPDGNYAEKTIFDSLNTEVRAIFLCILKEPYPQRWDPLLNTVVPLNCATTPYHAIFTPKPWICSRDRLFSDGNFAEKTIFDSLNSEHWSMSLLFFEIIQNPYPKYRLRPVDRSTIQFWKFLAKGHST